MLTTDTIFNMNICIIWCQNILNYQCFIAQILNAYKCGAWKVELYSQDEYRVVKIGQYILQRVNISNLLVQMRQSI